MARAPVMAKWYGGKARMRKKIMPLLPEAEVYVEPCGGVASIMLAREPAKVEVYNDMNGDLVNLFRAFQDPRRFRRLMARCRSTLYSYEEFAYAVTLLKTDEGTANDRAWAMLIACNQGFAGQGTTKGSWGRSVTSARGMAQPVSAWLGKVAFYPVIHERLQRVMIDSRDAIACIEYWDSDKSLFYIDPPYVPGSFAFAGDMYDTPETEWHVRLIDCILSAKGKVAISGYPSKLYDKLTGAGWDAISWDVGCAASPKTKKIPDYGGKAPRRTEMLWRNYTIQPKGK